MDKWEKFRENLLPEKDDFYSHLNIEYIANYHDLYVQSDTQF